LQNASQESHRKEAHRKVQSLKRDPREGKEGRTRKNYEVRGGNSMGGANLNSGGKKNLHPEPKKSQRTIRTVRTLVLRSSATCWSGREEY